METLVELLAKVSEGTDNPEAASVHKKLARMYCECLCLKKAFEHSEKAV